MVSIKANCVDSTAVSAAVFQKEMKKLQAENFKPAEQITLEPYKRDHAVVVGTYRPAKKAKKCAFIKRRYHCQSALVSHDELD